MPPQRSAIARPIPRSRISRAGPLLIALLVLLTAVRGAVRADPPAAVTRLSSDQARDAGVAVAILRHPTSTGLVVEAGLPAALRAGRLLAVAPEAGSVVLAAVREGDADALLLAMADGSQLWIRLAGARAATFSQDGHQLLVIDGAGSLWQVDTLTGDPRLRAEGPFAGRPLFGPDGAILLLAVSSVEAPITSQLVHLDPATAELEPASASQLVYGVFPLADGTLAIAAHQPGGAVVNRIDGDEESELVDLGPDAANVVVAANGAIAFERRGLGIFLLDPAGDTPRRLADGEHPAFAPDGSAVLVESGERILLVALDGSIIGRYGPQAAFASCPAGCAS